MSKSIYVSALKSLLGGVALAALSTAVASPGGTTYATGATPLRVAAAPASDARLNPRHPTRYVVQKGDTLWDISAMFLKDPWYWPEIWHVNPQVANPHLIYPGDVLALVYIDGQPRIVLESGGAVRMSPRARREPLADAIPTIPFDRIAAFLGRPRLLDKDTVEDAPYILTDRREHLVHGANTEVYVRGAAFDTESVYNIMSIGGELKDPDDGDVLGYEAVWVGEGNIVRTGDPATLYISTSAREAVNGDKILPVEEDFPLYFTPRAPEQTVEGTIMSVIDGTSLIGTYHIVALNRGTRNGVEPGHVLSVWQSGREVNDRFGGGTATLPEEYAGILMVFRSFDEMSYGIIVRSTSEIRVLDRVRNP
jgi:LysM repeat protein